MLFVILGAATLVAVLYGLIAAWRTRRALVAIHLVALILVIVAWSMGHMDFVGRISLSVAILLEAVAWLGIRHDAPAQSVVPIQRSRTPVPMFAAEPIYESGAPMTAEPIYDETHPAPVQEDASAAADIPPGAHVHEAVAVADEADDFAAGAVAIGEAIDDASVPVESQPATASAKLPQSDDCVAPSLQRHADAGTEICIRTLALLARPYHVTLSVLLASMKRAGMRQARLVEPEQETAPAYIELGPLKVGLGVIDEPVSSRRIEAAVAQSVLDDDAADQVRAHAAHIAVDVAYDRQAERADAVLLAMRAHAALMEFAPVVAVVWPEAASIVPASDAAGYIEATAADANSATRVCVSERRFALDGANAGLLVLDSIGLGAFGLPDAQIVVSEGEESRGIDALRELSLHFFIDGCNLPNGGHHALNDGSQWRVTYTRSAFDPDREVVQIRPDDSAPSTNGDSGDQAEHET